MKKITLITFFLLSITGLIFAQAIENFDSPKLEIPIFKPGDQSSFSIVLNPDPTGINTSKYVLKFVHDKDGYNGAGCHIKLDSAIKMEKLYMHLKVWKPRISTFFAHYWSTPNPLDFSNGWPQINSTGSINSWQEVVIMLSLTPTQIYSFGIYPDVTEPIGLTEDISIYIDDISINSSPEAGSEPLYILEDFEHIPLNLMLGGASDLSDMVLMPNPDPSGVNLSSNVIKYARDKDGVPWSGFWSLLQAPVDVTTNKYIHVKVWKSRISKLKFKIEGGEAGDLETESLYPQTKINEWEDIVFDFSEKTGSYPRIAFMPDFEDPVTLSEDITMYFDDIVLNNDPNPRTPTEQVINVDMTASGITEGQKVYISGNFGGIYGEWAEPGTIPENEMKDPDGDGIYTIPMHLADGLIEFQFHRGNDGSYLADEGTSNRLYTVSGNENLTYKWQLGGLVLNNNSSYDILLNVDMNDAGLSPGQQVFISGSMGGINGTWAEPGSVAQNEMSDPDGDGVYSISLSLPDGMIYFKFFKGSGWSGGEWDGDPNRSYSVNRNADLNFKWGTNGLYTTIDEYNLVKEGHFNKDGFIFPYFETPEWMGFSSYSGSAEIIDGECTIQTGVAGSNWQMMVGQRLNDLGTMLYNDSTYLLIFDAWAEKERVFSIDLEDNSSNNYKRFGLSTDIDAVKGESQWDINLTTSKTTYLRTFKCKSILPNTSFNLFIMTGVNASTVYIDNIYLVNANDISRLGGEATGIIITGEGGVSTIETDKGTLQMNAEFFPENAWIKSADWSVSNNSGMALIDPNGLLTAVKDGIVTVKATARDGSGISATKEISISNQVKMGFPVGFEKMTDMAWEVFGNGSSGPSDFIRAQNPKISKENPSNNVLKFIVNKDAESGTGAYSEAFAPLEFTESMHAVSMWVYKSIKSPTGFKVDQSTNGGPDIELKITTKKLNFWEKLTFNFSEGIGYSYPRITIYPDYPDTRTAGTIVYIDSIEMVTGPVGVESSSLNKTLIYPNPVIDELNVTLSSGNVWIEIYNNLGSKLDEFFVKGIQARIDVSDYPKGVYFIKVDKKDAYKFVK
ncbi:MAG: T9SS type A sorting domain-containing protein [Bacteroidales bacterium]|nr:T9SS type A sorting domain-containing protein [Bacteroidales bacterium]